MSTSPNDPNSTPVNVTPSSVTPGPDHLAVAPVLVKNKAFWRTALQVGPAAVLALVGILPAIIQDTVTGFGQNLPENFRLWLLGAAVTLTAVSATIARVMADPLVLAWFRTYAPFFSYPATKPGVGPTTPTN